MLINVEERKARCHTVGLDTSECRKKLVDTRRMFMIHGCPFQLFFSSIIDNAYEKKIAKIEHRHSLHKLAL